MARLRILIGDASPPALVLAGAIPLLFLHRNYQPEFSVSSFNVDLTDLAILAVVCTGLLAGVRHGWSPLVRGRAILLAALAFLVWLTISIGWARAADPSYPLGSNITSALKFWEYALLAPAYALGMRRAADRRLLYLTVVGWLLVMVVVAILQFLGDINQLNGHQPNSRESAYIGEHDFAAFGGAALGMLFAALLLRRERRLSITAGVLGAVAISIAAALDAVGGMWVALIAAFALARRRTRVDVRTTATLLAACALVTLGAVALRGSTIRAFLRFVGLESENAKTVNNVQSYAHRTLLGYIGLEIWLHHPVIGVGWQESARPHAFNPYLAGARKHFGKKEPAIAFPSPQHMWGVQNGIIQTLADLGIVGLALLLTLAVAVLLVIFRVTARGPPALVFEALVALAWVVFGFADFAGSGLFAGAVFEAQVWIGVGLVVVLSSAELTAPERGEGRVAA